LEDSDRILRIGMIILAIAFLSSGAFFAIYHIIYSFKLSNYMKKYHFEKWKELIDIGHIPFYYLKDSPEHKKVSKRSEFIRSEEAFGDPTLYRIKKRFYKTLLCFCIAPFVFMIMFFLLLFVQYILNKIKV